MGVRVAPLRLTLASSRWRGLELMAHQAQCLGMASEPRVLVEAPTGGGKTWAGAAPLVEAAVARGEWAIFVYPTNALADDQIDSLADVLRRAGYVPGISSDGSVSEPSADVLLWRAHAGVLDDVQDKLGGRTRGQTMSRLLERLPAKPLWLVTNPDTLYLLCTARYALSAQLWSRLSAARALVLDEFHLYRGPALVRALAMIELARQLLGIQRFRVLSATLPESVRVLLMRRFGFSCVTATAGSEGRIVQHAIDLSVEAAQGEAATDRIVQRATDLLPSLRAERAPGHVPLLVLRQSVLATIALEDRLVAQGLERDEIGIYRGLMSKTVRDVENKTLVLGTSALEVGVDFKTGRLVLEASSSASFAQRLGRVGRHAPGEALFLTSPRVAAAFGADRGCDRAELLQLAGLVLAGDDDLPSFPQSPFARAVAAAAFGALRERGSKLEAPEAFFSAIDDAERALFDQLDVHELPPLELMSRGARARLRDSVGFRGGEGTVEIFDVPEKRRRGSADLARYEVDLATFFRRAEWRGTPDTSRHPLVVGYRKPRRVAIGLNMTSIVGVGLHAPSPDQIELRIDGDPTAWEVLLREREHLVGIFPAALRDALSWREDVFESDDGRIALLDDDAIVAAFLYWKRARGDKGT